MKTWYFCKSRCLPIRVFICEMSLAGGWCFRVTERLYQVGGRFAGINHGYGNVFDLGGIGSVTSPGSHAGGLCGPNQGLSMRLRDGLRDYCVIY